MKTVMANTGARMIFIGLIATVALIPAWLEIGSLTEVLTWFAVADAGTVILGAALFTIGDRQ